MTCVFVVAARRTNPVREPRSPQRGQGSEVGIGCFITCARRIANGIWIVVSWELPWSHLLSKSLQLHSCQRRKLATPTGCWAQCRVSGSDCAASRTNAGAIFPHNGPIGRASSNSSRIPGHVDYAIWKVMTSSGTILIIPPRPWTRRPRQSEHHSTSSARVPLQTRRRTGVSNPPRRAPRRRYSSPAALGGRQNDAPSAIAHPRLGTLP